MSLKLGDSVTYIYGGPQMTIETTYMHHKMKYYVCVYWNDRKGQFVFDSFLESSLKKKEPEKKAVLKSVT